MILELSTQQAQKAVNAAAKLASAKACTAAGSSIKITAHKDLATFGAFSDTKRAGIEMDCPVEFSKEGTVLVPAMKLREVLGECGAKTVVLKATANKLNFKCGSYIGALPISNAVYFPTVWKKPNESVTIIDGQLILRLMERGEHALGAEFSEMVTIDEIVQLTLSSSGMRVYATNRSSFVLASAALELDIKDEYKLEIHKSLIGAIRGAVSLSDGPISVGLDPMKISFAGAMGRFQGPAAAGKVADFSAYITPDQDSRRIVVNAGAAAKALERAAVGLDAARGGAILCKIVDGRLWFRSVGSELPMADSVELKSPSAELLFGVAYRYLKNSLSGPGDVEIAFKGPMDKLVFTHIGEEFGTRFATMPQRIAGVTDGQEDKKAA